MLDTEEPDSDGDSDFEDSHRVTEEDLGSDSECEIHMLMDSFRKHGRQSWLVPYLTAQFVSAAGRTQEEHALRVDVCCDMLLHHDDVSTFESDWKAWLAHRILCTDQPSAEYRQDEQARLVADVDAVIRTSDATPTGFPPDGRSDSFDV